MEKAHEVTKIHFENDRITLIVDGKKYVIALADCSRKLLDASDEARRNFVISATGYGIHWPELDEDLSVDRLIGATKERPPFKTVKRGRVTGARANGVLPT